MKISHSISLFVASFFLQVHPTLACNKCDAAAKVVLTATVTNGTGMLLATLSPGSEVCVDNQTNMAVSLPPEQTWVYFRVGLRAYQGTMLLNALQEIH